MNDTDEKEITHVYAVYQVYGVFDSQQSLWWEKADAEKEVERIRSFGLKAYVKKKEVR